jgi:hypothetical protein
MDAPTTLTMRCTACGALAQAACNCGAPYAYISPGELAAKALKDNPALSDREIANKLGIGATTVRRARPTAPNGAVEKRTGKDGKTRRMPKRKRPSKAPGVKQAQRSIDVTPATWEEVKLRAAAADMSAAQLIGELLTNTTEINPRTLPKTTQEKLAVALRAQQRALNAEFEKRVAAEYTARVKAGFPELEKMERDARDTKRAYEQWLRESKKLGTLSDWNNLMFCLHPDTRRTASNEKFDAALAWVMKRKFAITGMN